MKRMLSFLLVWLLCAASAWAYDFKVGGLAYNISKNNDSEVYVTYTTSSTPSATSHSTYRGDIEVPTEVTYDGKTYVVVEVGPWAFAFCTSLTSVKLPESVTHIDTGCFYQCTRLTSVNIPSKTYYIGLHAFKDCAQLSTVINIPATTEYMDPAAFVGCYGVTAINVASANPTYKSISGVVFSKDGKKLLMYPSGKAEAYTIPGTVTSVGGYAFRKAGAISVTIPPSVTRLGIESFEESAITRLALPATLEDVSWDAFKGCYNLKTITIEEGIGKIGAYSFSKLSALRDVFCNAKSPWEISSDVFDEPAQKNTILHVPKGCVANYKAAEVWKDFAIILDDYDNYLSPDRNDVNADGVVNVTDITALINIILSK